jgi:Uma2 family endonuclease
MATREETQVRWTIADLECLPDHNGTRYEIIEGELHMSKSPHWHHQRACSNIHISLGTWNQESGLGEVVETPGIIFSIDDAVIPDLVWVSKKRLAAILGEDGKLHGAPELVIEVLSPGIANERRDKDAKRKLYSVRGVSEYWIVDWSVQTVEVYRRESAALQLVATLHQDDELTSPLLPEFRLKVRQIFA